MLDYLCCCFVTRNRIIIVFLSCFCSNEQQRFPMTMTSSLILTAVLFGLLLLDVSFTVNAFSPVGNSLGRMMTTSPTTQLEMKVVNSIGSLKKRSKTCQVIRRRGRIYLIDKKNPRNKCRQGGAKQKKRFVRSNKKRKYKN